MFKIEKGVPMTAPSRVRSGKWKDLLGKMDVGDSVVVNNKHRQQLHAISKRLGIKYKTRTICKESNTVRFWRTK